MISVSERYVQQNTHMQFRPTIGRVYGLLRAAYMRSHVSRKHDFLARHQAYVCLCMCSNARGQISSACLKMLFHVSQTNN